MKLTKPQRYSLEVLVRQDKPMSAYALQLRINTLEALERRKMVSMQREIGAIFSPHTGIRWRITDAGRKALKGGSE